MPASARIAYTAAAEAYDPYCNNSRDLLTCWRSSASVVSSAQRYSTWQLNSIDRYSQALLDPYHCLNGLAPSYLSCDFQRVSDLVARQRLRSSSPSTLVVPLTRRSTADDRAFPLAAAQTWNSLPASLTMLSSLASFRRQLKTELFVRSFPDLDTSVYDRIWQSLYSLLCIAIAFCHCF